MASKSFQKPRLETAASDPFLVLCSIPGLLRTQKEVPPSQGSSGVLQIHLTREPRVLCSPGLSILEGWEGVQKCFNKLTMEWN